MSTSVYDKKKRCPVCRKEFWAARYKATFCSATCRQRAHRKPPLEKRVVGLYDDAHAAINGLIAVNDRANGYDQYRAQKRLQTLAIEIIQGADEQTRKLIYEQLKDDFFRIYRDNQMSRYRPED